MNMLEEIAPTHIRYSDQTRLGPKATGHTGMREFTMSHAARDPVQDQKQTNCSDVSLTFRPGDSFALRDVAA